MMGIIRWAGFGLCAIVLLAATVLVLAVWSNKKTIQVRVILRVEPAALWRAISNHSALAQHTSGFLREVKVLQQEEGGVGTVRLCTLGSGKSFKERITVWEEGRRYCYRPDTAQAPFPFKWAEACWSIEPQGEGSSLTYRLQYEPKSRFRDLVTYPYLRIYGVRGIRKMLVSYDAKE